MNKKSLHWEIFSKKHLTILPKLTFLKKLGFYLAGGTALALQIKHRISVDFDFYSQNRFDSNKIYQMFQEQKPKKLLLDTMAENTLILEINNIGISLFTYSYLLIKPSIITKYLNIASLEDIATMKLIAIIQRGVKRDFIDLYYLCKDLGLENILTLTGEKYAGFNKYLALQAIVYFQDAGKKQTREMKMLKPLNWEDVKEYFVNEAAKLKLKWSSNEK